MAIAASVPISNDNIIDAMLQGSAWIVPSSQPITYAVSNGPFGEFWTDSHSVYLDLKSAMDQLNYYTGVSTEFVGFFDTPMSAAASAADITLSLTGSFLVFPDSDAWARAFFPDSNGFYYAGEQGDLLLNINSQANNLPSYSPGSAGYFLLLHELGHALGLKHPHDDGGNYRPTFEDLDIGFANSDVWTVMSYQDNASFNLIEWDPATFMVLDVIALQYLYGQSNAGSGDDTYTYEGSQSYQTIWDSGGINTVDATDAPFGVYVALPNESISDLIDSPVGLGLPQGQSVIEGFPTELAWLLGDFHHALGSAYDDTLLGNFHPNRLLGSGGNDQIDGGEGIDTAAYSGNQTSYTLTLGSDSTLVEDRRSNGNGTDSLLDVELIDFDTDLLGSAFDLRVFGGPTGLSPAEFESFIELYIAYFNRAPDAVGLNFWGTAFANGTTLDEMATLFIDQAETRAAYPDGTANEVFAETVYENVLGRVPDLAGFIFWVGLLDDGTVQRDAFILEVLRGAKAAPPVGATQDFINQQLADQQYLTAKIDIGAYYAVHKGMSDVDSAAAAMALFDGSESSIDTVIGMIDSFYSDALDPTDGEFLMQLVGVLDNPFLV